MIFHECAFGYIGVGLDTVSLLFVPCFNSIQHLPCMVKTFFREASKIYLPTKMNLVVKIYSKAKAVVRYHLSISFFESLNTFEVSALCKLKVNFQMNKIWHYPQHQQGIDSTKQVTKSSIIHTDQ